MFVDMYHKFCQENILFLRPHIYCKTLHLLFQCICLQLVIYFWTEGIPLGVVCVLPETLVQKTNILICMLLSIPIRLQIRDKNIFPFFFSALGSHLVQACVDPMHSTRVSVSLYMCHSHFIQKMSQSFVAIRRHHDHCNSYKGEKKTLICGWLTIQRVRYHHGMK